MPQELHTYITDELRDGTSPEDIAHALRHAGWHESSIEHGIRTCKAELNPPKTPSDWVRYGIIIGSVLVCISATAAIAYSVTQRDTAPHITITSEHEPPEPLQHSVTPPLFDETFFAETKNTFLTNQTTFIEADLSAMTITLYENGTSTTQLPILSKGREGSWWETPAGLYTINTKEEEHFSTIGHVMMPWSLNFQGNFFIHGETYYPDGTPTASTFTGGCIRLATADAKTLYKLVSTTTPLLVVEDSFASDDFSYHSTGISNTQSYLAADLNNRHVFTTHNADSALPMGGITHLMTALIATEYINLDKTIGISEAMLTETAHPRLVAGERHSIYQLLFPLLMEESNEAANAISAYLGEQRFVSLMNKKARAIGMQNTTFVDASGDSPDNITTAEDLFLLAQYIYHNRSFVFNLTAGTVTNNAYEKSAWPQLRNTNSFLERADFVGNITDSTGGRSVTVLDVDFEGATRPVVFITLQSNDVTTASQQLLDFVTD